MAESVQNIRRVVWIILVVALLACPAMAVSIPSDGFSTSEEWEKAFKKWDSGRSEWKQPKMAPNKLPFPVDYRDLRVLSISHREDESSVRVVLGNDVAIRAARQKMYNPWPEGSMLVKVLWRQRKLPGWDEASVPAEVLGIGIMYKDSKQFKETLGWGFSLWKSADFTLPEDFNTEVEGCVRCHSPLKDSDYVFTVPAIFP